MTASNKTFKVPGMPDPNWPVIESDAGSKILGYYRGCMLVRDGALEGEIEIYSPKQYNPEESCTTRYIVGAAKKMEDAKALIDEDFGRLGKKDPFGVGIDLDLR